MVPQENLGDPSPIVEAKFVKYTEVTNYISWMKDSQEYLTVKNQLSKYKLSL